MMVAKVGVVRDIYWGSHLIQNMDLREVPLAIFQGRGGLLDHKMEPR